NFSRFVKYLSNLSANVQIIDLISGGTMRKLFASLGVRFLIIVIAGFVLIVAAGVWKFGISRTWTQRIPPGWTWVSNSITQQANVDPATHKLPDPGSNKANIY